jgi:hypothetical protein
MVGLLQGERKSIEPMAARLPDGNVQAMQCERPVRPVSC